MFGKFHNVWYPIKIAQYSKNEENHKKDLKTQQIKTDLEVIHII